MQVCGNKPEAKQTQAFSGFRSFGRQLFQQTIYLDCMEQVASQFGEDSYTQSTEELPRVTHMMVNGKWTKLDWILNGISNLLWYVDNTNFFKYTTGSKTYYLFRFPIFYRKMVREDSVKVHFEKPGPVVPCHQLEGTQLLSPLCYVYFTYQHACSMLSPTGEHKSFGRTSPHFLYTCWLLHCRTSYLNV
jgi:hypothetical protein